VPVTILVPRGAEEQAVRRSARGATVIAMAAGAGSATLPAGVDAAGFVVVAGLCGSLTAARVGDVVVYTRIVSAEGTEELDQTGVVRALALISPSRPVVACTTDHVVTKAAERAALAAHFSADVVDMEALHVARALRARGIAFAMVRVVSDDPSADLPPIEDALDSSGAIRPLALATAFARAPVAAFRFVRDVQTSLRVLGWVGMALAALK
jgi:nucleoside phosphorylase